MRPASMSADFGYTSVTCFCRPVASSLKITSDSMPTTPASGAVSGTTRRALDLAGQEFGRGRSGPGGGFGQLGQPFKVGLPDLDRRQLVVRC